MKRYCVHILASPSRTLYTGVTSDPARHIAEHKAEVVSGFTSKYNVTKRVHVESTDDSPTAIAREKQMKAWRREKMLQLIEFQNPHWTDLSDTLAIS